MLITEPINVFPLPRLVWAACHMATCQRAAHSILIPEEKEDVTIGQLFILDIPIVFPGPPGALRTLQTRLFCIAT